MATKKRTNAYCKRVLNAYVKHHGNKAHAAKAMGLATNTYKCALEDAIERFGEPQIDVVVKRRATLGDKVHKRTVETLEKQAAELLTIREAVMGLTAKPIEPPHWNPYPRKEAKTREAVVLFLSDIHMGECVSLADMGGRNSYNVQIAKARLERYFKTVVKLGTEHWTGLPPDSLYLVLGGDLVSGEIHEELSKTNELQSIPSVRVLVETLAAGIDLLRRSFPKLPINVISVPGNHARVTKKPEAKQFTVNSYDTLVAWMLEMWAEAKGLPNVTFSAPHSGDAVVNIHGWNVLFTHGDRIGSRGGQGFVGPAATAARGMQKLAQDYLSEGVVIDTIVMGHFHTDLELEFGFGNGSVIGPNEYSRSGRMRAHPAAQWMITISPKHRVARRWKIELGDASEGSIYAGRAA